MTSFKLRRLAAWLVGGLLAVLIGPGLALADATPVQLVLLYMPNVSNTGTGKASGIAELVLQEGEVRISGTDLPRLDDTNVYMAWLVNTKTNEFQRIGDFNSAQTTGAVHYENVLPDAIPDHNWNLLLVTIEDDNTADHPSADHSIAGVFPNPDNAPLPGVLPNTGGLPDDAVAAGQWPASIVDGADWLPTAGLVALTFSLGLVAGYAVRKRRDVPNSLSAHPLLRKTP